MTFIPEYQLNETNLATLQLLDTCKLLEIFTGWRRGCERLYADRIMAECGEVHLQDVLREKEGESAADTRHVADSEGQKRGKQSLTTFAEVLDRGSSLYLRQQKREQEDQEKEARKRIRIGAKDSRKVGQNHEPTTNKENIDPRLLQSQATEFLFSRSSQLSTKEISQLLSSQNPPFHSH